MNLEPHRGTFLTEFIGALLFLALVIGAISLITVRDQIEHDTSATANAETAAALQATTATRTSLPPSTPSAQRYATMRAVPVLATPYYVRPPQGLIYPTIHIGPPDFEFPKCRDDRHKAVCRP
jgi:hypothetical protein